MVKKHQSNIWLLIVGLIMALLGVYVLFNPVTALMALALYLGIAFIAMGIGYIAFYRYAKSHLLLAIAIVDIIIGLLFVLNLSVTATTLPIIFAMWVLFVGILQIVTAFEYRDMGDSTWGWTLTAGLIGIIFGFMILFYPVVGVLTITAFMGAALVLYGAYDISLYLRAK